MDKYRELYENTRCPECAQIMGYREETHDWLCRPCWTVFAFSIGRWFSSEPDDGQEAARDARAAWLIEKAFR